MLGDWVLFNGYRVELDHHLPFAQSGETVRQTHQVLRHMYQNSAVISHDMIFCMERPLRTSMLQHFARPVTSSSPATLLLLATVVARVAAAPGVMLLVGYRVDQ